MAISKRQSERLSSRKETLLKKSYEIAAFCDVDVALFFRIRKTGRLITYKSLDLESWLPLKEQIVSACKLVQDHTLTQQQQSIYPFLVNLLPQDVEARYGKPRKYN
jgi:hypothetical protein